MKMKDLNIAQIQMMEIIKAVSYNSKVIIMDEPTSSLSEKETETLLRSLTVFEKERWNHLYFSSYGRGIPTGGPRFRPS